MTVSALKRVSIGAALLVALSAFLLIAGWNIATPGLYYDELLFVDAALGGPNGIFKHISFGSLPVMLMKSRNALPSNRSSGVPRHVVLHETFYDLNVLPMLLFHLTNHVNEYNLQIFHQIFWLKILHELKDVPY